MPEDSPQPVAEAVEPLRLDVYLAGEIEDASRSFLKKAIKDGCVRVNGTACTRPSRLVRADDEVEIDLPPPPETDLKPQAIRLDILYEDGDLLVVNKPTGLVVHPAPGHPDGTLVNAVLHHCPDFQRTGVEALRPGIVHRLDRDTSGVMVVAKSPRAFLGLAQQAREHTFDRQSLGLVRGEFKEDAGRIVAPIGRSLSTMGRMSVTGVRGREAVTNFHVLERFGVASLIALQLETGRTHQIRVHMRFAGHPILGDPVYGVTDFSRMTLSAATREAFTALKGQALHAEMLGFSHPGTQERMRFSAPPPLDFQAALAALRES